MKGVFIRSNLKFKFLKAPEKNKYKCQEKNDNFTQN